MDCPICGAQMDDVTESWHTFAEAEGAEYLAFYVTIWHCPRCNTVFLGAGDGVTAGAMPDRDVKGEILGPFSFGKGMPGLGHVVHLGATDRAVHWAF